MAYDPSNPSLFGQQSMRKSMGVSTNDSMGQPPKPQPVPHDPGGGGFMGGPSRGGGGLFGGDGGQGGPPAGGGLFEEPLRKKQINDYDKPMAPPGGGGLFNQGARDASGGVDAFARSMPGYDRNMRANQGLVDQSGYTQQRAVRPSGMGTAAGGDVGGAWGDANFAAGRNRGDDGQRGAPPGFDRWGNKVDPTGGFNFQGGGNGWVDKSPGGGGGGGVPMEDLPPWQLGGGEGPGPGGGGGPMPIPEGGPNWKGLLPQNTYQPGGGGLFNGQMLNQNGVAINQGDFDQYGRPVAGPSMLGPGEGPGPGGGGGPMPIPGGGPNAWRRQQRGGLFGDEGGPKDFRSLLKQ